MTNFFDVFSIFILGTYDLASASLLSIRGRKKGSQTNRSKQKNCQIFDPLKIWFFVSVWISVWSLLFRCIPVLPHFRTNWPKNRTESFMHKWSNDSSHLYSHFWIFRRCQRQRWIYWFLNCAPVKINIQDVPTSFGKIFNKKVFQNPKAKKLWKFVYILANQCKTPFNLTNFSTKDFKIVIFFLVSIAHCSKS